MKGATMNRTIDIGLGIIAVIVTANAASASNLTPSGSRDNWADAGGGRVSVVTDVPVLSVEPRGVPGGKPIAPAPTSELRARPAGRIIDVSLNDQVLRLYEGGEEVFRSPVATGVEGAETPTGNFAVQYHMAQARFQGENPDGRRYDIPDVPWILAFSGDYTIHAAPWRSQFGQVGSNGCVTLPLEAAKFVYEWAEDGTPIYIHP
jgi:lipoprotein-anchoring transpeptidase ErfK/SrfK